MLLSSDLETEAEPFEPDHNESKSKSIPGEEPWKCRVGACPLTASLREWGHARSGTHPGAWSFPHLGTPTWSFPHPGEYLEANRAPGAVWGTSHSVPQGLGTPSESSRGPSKVLPPERGAVPRTRQLQRADGPGSGQRRGQGSGSGTLAGIRGPGEDYSDQVTDQTPSRQKEGEKGRLWDHGSGSLEGTT